MHSTSWDIRKYPFNSVWHLGMYFEMHPSVENAETERSNKMKRIIKKYLFLFSFLKL